MAQLKLRRCWIYFTVVGCFVFCGCGGDDDPWNRAAVEGTVSLDGEPLKTGNITFFPAQGIDGPAAGAEIVDGLFSLSDDKGPVVGTNRIVIRSVQATGRKVKHDGFIESDGAPQAGQMVEEFRNVIPPQYNSKSILEWDIQSDTINKKEFELTTDESK